MSTFYTNVFKYGNSIMFRGYSNGKPVEQKIKFKPEMFLETNEPTEYHDIHGVPVKSKKFEDMKSASEYVKRMKDVDNFRIYGYDNYIVQFNQRMFPGEIKWDMKHIAVTNLDIEVFSKEGFPEPNEAKYPIVTIALRNSKSSIYHVWGMKDFDHSDPEAVPEGYLLKYRKCDTEEDLLESFLHYWENHYPDVISGWYVRMFDIPYLINRIQRVFDDKGDNARRLSPWKQIRYVPEKINDQESDTYIIQGISILDGIDTFKKFGFTYGTQESYSLDHIAHIVLGERKLSYDEYESLDDLYDNDYQKFVKYNIKDVVLVERIEEVTKFLQLAITIAYIGGVNYVDSLGTVAIWESIFYRHLMDKKQVFPPYDGPPAKVPYVGGYVKDPIVGKHDWVVSFDLNSLYPLTIVTMNMSPETFLGMSKDYPQNIEYWLNTSLTLDEHKDKGYSIARNGAMFSTKKQGFMPEIIEGFYKNRSKSKGQMLDTRREMEKHEEGSRKYKELEVIAENLDNLQHAIKILLNSVYGALGTRWFRFNDVRIAEAITMMGQLVIQWGELHINGLINDILGTDSKDYVLAADTDSAYIGLSDLVEKYKPKDPVYFLDQVAIHKIEPVIEDAYDKLYKRHMGYKNSWAMSREVIASSGIWQKKKRYILNVIDNEGVRYAKPHMKIMGIEAVKSSTPQIVRDRFNEVFKILLEGEESDMQKYVKSFREEFKKLDPEEVSFPRGISDIEKWKQGKGYKKGTPIHVRGAISYNNLLEEHGLNLETIKNGTKVKFTYLKLPNPTHENVISYNNYLPREFKLNEYIDYNTQFEKTFVNPLEMITSVIGWDVEQVNTVEDLFV